MKRILLSLVLIGLCLTPTYGQSRLVFSTSSPPTSLSFSPDAASLYPTMCLNGGRCRPTSEVLAFLAEDQRVVTLSAPVVATATTTVMRPARVEFNVVLGTVSVTMLPYTAGAFVTTAPPLNVVYNGTTTPTGASLIISLNKANLSTTSLEERIITQLTSSGFLAGAVSGTVP